MNYFDRWSRQIFHPIRMTNPIRPGWLSRLYRIRWKPTKLPLPQNPSDRTDVFCPLLYQQQLTTMRRAVWFMDPWIYSSRSRGFPVENELDELIPPLTIQLLHSWTTFSGDLHTSLPQQTGPRIMAEYFIPNQPSNSWTFGSTLRDPNVPSCKWTRRINSASDNSATSFLETVKETTITYLSQQPGLHIYGWTFTPVLKSATQYLLCLQRRVYNSDI